MPSKKVNIGAKPTSQPKQDIDDWVKQNRETEITQSESPANEAVEMKRLTLDIPKKLHTAIKAKAVQDGVSMVDMLRNLLEENYGK